MAAEHAVARREAAALLGLDVGIIRDLVNDGLALVAAAQKCRSRFVLRFVAVGPFGELTSRA